MAGGFFREHYRILLAANSIVNSSKPTAIQVVTLFLICRIRGVKGVRLMGVRLMCAIIMRALPKTSRAFPVSLTFVISEKAADAILRGV